MGIELDNPELGGVIKKLKDQQDAVNAAGTQQATKQLGQYGISTTAGNNASAANNDLSVIGLIIVHRGNAKFGAVPRHVWMVPTEPREHVARRIHARRSNKV